jgi:hypothetical protein
MLCIPDDASDVASIIDDFDDDGMPDLVTDSDSDIELANAKTTRPAASPAARPPAPRPATPVSQASTAMPCTPILDHAGHALASNRNEKFSVMDMKVIVLDTGAYPTTCSQGFLDKHGIAYTVVAEYNPPRKVRTAKGNLKAYKYVHVPNAYEHSLYDIEVLVLHSDRPHRPHPPGYQLPSQG